MAGIPKKHDPGGKVRLVGRFCGLFLFASFLEFVSESFERLNR
jgi:hypothetical protein